MKLYNNNYQDPKARKKPARKSFIHYNAHPKKAIIVDEMTRAICTIEARNYNDVKKELIEIAKKLDKNAQLLNYDKEIFENYISTKKYKKISLAGGKKTNYTTIESFCNIYTQGRYLGLYYFDRARISCVIDSYLYDLHFASRARIITAYKYLD